MSKEQLKRLEIQLLEKLAKHDPLAFGEYIFGHKPAPHHAEMIEFIEERLRKHEHCVILEPRGHAKTTWANTIYIAWKLASDPDRKLRVAVISNTAKQSNAFSRAIRATFEVNERFRELFGNLVSNQKWTDVEWILADSPLLQTKDVSCYSNGALGAIISKRFDIIICDDIIDDENCANIDQMEKIENWFWKTLKPCLAPGGSIVVIGTRWGEGDLYEKLIREKHWPHLIKGAIEKDKDGKDVALWPEVWPLDLLYAEREDMGLAMFACSYLNDITGLMAGNVFRRENFQYFSDLPPDRSYRIRMGVDLASSEKERADYTARVVVAEDSEYNHYVLSVYRDRRSSGHREFVLDGWMAYPAMERVIIESQQFQSTLVQDLLDSSPIPVVGKKADTDKVTRARSVAARYEGHKVWHHEGLRGSEFETEMLSFPKGHDDMVDALGYAMDLAGTRLVYGSLRR